MSRVCTLVALTAAALLASAGRASAAHVTANPPMPANAREGVNAVTAVSIVPSSGRAEVVVALSGPVDVQDFVLTSPDRVVLDLTGARLSMPPHMYDKVSRAGITNVRIAQYKPNVVRLVLELDSSREYEITRHDNEIRIAVTGPEKFAAWHAGDKNASNSVASTGTVVVKPENTDRMFAASPAAALKERLTFNQQRSQQPRITVTYPGSDIRDVIAAFATFSGRTIVIGKDVQGTVTAEIKDQPWDVALQAILQSQGLAASEENTGIISVDSYANILAKEANEPLTTQLVSINYANASSLIGTISSLLSKDCSKAGLTTAASGSANQQQQNIQGAAATCIVRGGVVADTSTNTLLVTEVASRLPDMMSYIKDLDVRTPQVALRAKIISVNRTSIEQLGVSYDLASPEAFFNTLAPHTYDGAPTTTLE